MPGLRVIQAFESARQAERQRENDELRRTMGTMGVLAQIQQQQRQDQLRGILAQSGGDLDKVTSSLLSAGPEGVLLASRLAPLIKQQRESRLMEGLDPGTMEPEQLDTLAQRLSAFNPTAATGLMNLADKRRALAQQRAGIGAMQTGPMQPAEVLPPGVEGPPRPEMPGNLGVTEELQNSPYPAIANAAKSLQRTIDQGGGGLNIQQIQNRIDNLTRMHIAAEERRAASERAQQNKVDFRVAFPPNAPQPQVVGTESGFMSPTEILALPPEQRPRPVTAANIDYRWATQRQTQYNKAIERPQQNLFQVGMYGEARRTGDNAQAAIMAAQALRQSSRSSDRALKGEVEKLLGAGYGSGNLWERAENFIAQEFKGAPSANTLSKIDKLISASETANLRQIAMQMQQYANQAKVRQIPIALVIVPFVRGNKVAMPNGEVANFPNPEAAQSFLNDWMEQNR